jgi:hypothetical protein
MRLTTAKEGEFIMRKIVWNCYDCGSDPITTRIEDDNSRGPILVISFACGAVLRTSQNTSGGTGSIVFAGCSHDE